ncbi:glycosyl transferase family 2 [Nonlabens arenilitoris]|uniref:Glycosyl transferase family 2 n=2 Tax=Nonlabens arenilitoris TaxID=1217969 RepID=A0A2S7UB89_9FLAO|nr:glycosyl transferase family 2 [Nonlabens arenilitoris]
MRPEPLSRLLETVMSQTHVPAEILIIDGSTDDATQLILDKFNSISNSIARSEVIERLFLNSSFNPNARSEVLEDRLSSSASNSIISYYKVPPEHRGLTKQRNYGIERVREDIDIVAFLDDDTVLDQLYFENLKKAFLELPDASGIGGIATNENRWKKKAQKKYDKHHYYIFEDHVIKESTRNVLRNKLHLGSNELPGVLPSYSHGRTFSYPITGKYYPVDLIVGMSMSFRKKVVDQIKFSKFFEGYGLYEDADFSLRALSFGQNYLATNVQLEHHHDAAGRPNKYRYGKMVVRNGWYVWRVKHPNPSFKNKIKWYQITILLTTIRFLNIFTTNERKEAFTEAIGRTVGILSLLFNKPK